MIPSQMPRSMSQQGLRPPNNVYQSSHFQPMNFHHSAYLPSHPNANVGSLHTSTNITGLDNRSNSFRKNIITNPMPAPQKPYVNQHYPTELGVVQTNLIGGTSSQNVPKSLNQQHTYSFTTNLTPGSSRSTDTRLIRTSTLPQKPVENKSRINLVSSSGNTIALPMRPTVVDRALSPMFNIKHVSCAVQTISSTNHSPSQSSSAIIEQKLFDEIVLEENKLSSSPSTPPPPPPCEQSSPIINQRTHNLRNFPKYRSHHFNRRLRRNGINFNPKTTMNTVRQLLQNTINSEIDSVLNKYMQNYFEVVQTNIIKNLGQGSFTELDMSKLKYRIMRRACKRYVPCVRDDSDIDSLTGSVYSSELSEGLDQNKSAIDEDEVDSHTSDKKSRRSARRYHLNNNNTNSDGPASPYSDTLSEYSSTISQPDKDDAASINLSETNTILPWSHFAESAWDDLNGLDSAVNGLFDGDKLHANVPQQHQQLQPHHHHQQLQHHQQHHHHHRTLDVNTEFVFESHALEWLMSKFDRNSPTKSDFIPANFFRYICDQVDLCWLTQEGLLTPVSSPKLKQMTLATNNLQSSSSCSTITTTTSSSSTATKLSPCLLLADEVRSLNFPTLSSSNNVVGSSSIGQRKRGLRNSLKSFNVTMQMIEKMQNGYSSLSEKSPQSVISSRDDERSADSNYTISSFSQLPFTSLYLEGQTHHDNPPTALPREDSFFSEEHMNYLLSSTSPANLGNGHGYSPTLTESLVDNVIQTSNSKQISLKHNINSSGFDDSDSLSLLDPSTPAPPTLDKCESLSPL